jgi:hypothetical protein
MATTVRTAPPSAAPKPASNRLRRVAGVLALAHLVVMFGSYALQKVAPLGAGSATITADHVTWSMSKGFAGGYLTALSYLLLLLAATLLARLLSTPSELSGWLTGTMTAAASVLVAVTFAAMANLGAALYDGHHGAALETVTVLDHAHWFGIFLATTALGLFTAATGAAALAAHALPRWVAWSGVAVGALCIASAAGAGSGAVDTSTLVWTVWFVCLAVTLLRRGGRPQPGSDPLASDSAVEHSLSA